MKNKKDILNSISDVRLKTLIGKIDDKNKLISGDGIDGILSLLMLGNKYELVMIDPPYNENKSKGKYQDQWTGHSEEFSWAGEKHAAYLEFLSPRIKLGKEILTDDGLMMLFIGDGEPHYVRVIMDKIFGEENYVGTVIWDSSSNQQKTKPIDRNHEYVFVYAKDMDVFSKLGLYTQNTESVESELFSFAQELKNNSKSYEENQLTYLDEYKVVSKKVNDLKKKGEEVTLGNFKYISPNYTPFYCGDAGDPRNGSKKKLIHPITKKECPLPANGKGWRYSDDYLMRIANSKNVHVLYDGRVFVAETHDKKEDIIGIVFGKDEQGVPNTARAYSQKTDKKVMTTTGHTYKGDKKQGIDPKTGFETVKPAEFLMELLLNYPKKDARVLDYFAGSGSTAVAVHGANEKDGGTRSWTLIELNPETLEKVLMPKLKHFGIKNYSRLEMTDKDFSKKELMKIIEDFELESALELIEKLKRQ